jgi:hypothetical protein
MSNSTEPNISNIKEVTPEFFKEKFESSLSYNDYKDLVINLAENKSTTGTDQSDSRISNTRLNAARMKRIDKTVNVLTGAEDAFANLKKEYVWLVLTESWCGDSAQSIPVINMIAELSDAIEMGFVFRDENPELMDCCLTNGTKSIPKLIAVDKATYTLLGTWGPRPAPAQNMMLEYKEKKHKEYNEVQKDIALWYTKDNGITLQKELIELIKDWENK